MHVPLYLSCDALNKTKSPWSSVCWIGQETGSAYSFTNGNVDQIQLQTSSSQGITKLNKIYRNISVINTTFQGTTIYGLLTSGDLFFWDLKTKRLNYVKGFPELSSHKPRANVDNRGGTVYGILDKFRVHHKEHEGGEAHEIGGQSVQCDVPQHQQPKIFASDDCSKVVVVVGASQAYVWLKHSTNFNNEHREFLCGEWSVSACPTDVLLPSQASRETEISACFCNEAAGGEQCLVTFSFIGTSSLVFTTLSLHWATNNSRILSASWYTVLTACGSLGIKVDEIITKRGSLISRYAHNHSFMCVAVNSPERLNSKLVYLQPLSETVVTESIEKSRSRFNFNETSCGEAHWVADMAWSLDNSYLVGCLRNGSIFLATRMGPIMKISCTGENLNLQPSSLLGLHPHLFPTRKIHMEDESPNNWSYSDQVFSVCFHPYCNKFLFSSGHRISVLSLPENCSRGAEVVDLLIQTAIHALHSLRKSSVTHDYAYIRSSTWKLAQSLPNLYQSCENVTKMKNSEMKLWSKEETNESQNRVKMLPDEEEVLIENIVKHLLGAWTFILTEDKPHTREWKTRLKRISKIFVSFISVMLQTTMDDDRPVHQAQIVHMLHIFHRFVSLLCVWPKSLHMVKSTLSLGHKIIHAILLCEKHSNERYKLDTILVLSQTISCVENQMLMLYDFQPLMDSRYDFHGILESSPSCQVTNVKVLATGAKKDPYVPVIKHRLKTMWKCLYSNVKKIYVRIQQKFDKTTYQKCAAVLNLVQRSLQEHGCDISFPKLKLEQGNKLCISGLYYSAIKTWKKDVNSYLAQNSNSRSICKYLHSILYTYLFLHDFSGLGAFIEWLTKIITNDNSLSNSSSSHASHSSPKRREEKGCILSSEARRNSPYDVDKKESSGNDMYLKPKRPEKQLEEISGTKSANIGYNKNVILAVQKLIGSFGRILARFFMKKDVFVPLPHRPHVVPPLWFDDKRTEDEAMVFCCTNSLKNAIQECHLTAEVAAQALCFSGSWYDLVVFAQELEDKRISLLSSIVISKTESSRSTLSSCFFPEVIIKELMMELWCTRELDASLFQCFQDLIKLSAMGQVQILPDILTSCISTIRSVVEELPLIVFDDIYLPAPPVFCPQIIPNEELKEEDELGGNEEGSFRKIMARWVRLFAVIISASGVSQHLLSGMCNSYDHGDGLESDIYFQEISKLSDTLAVGKGLVPQGPEWTSIFNVWQELLYHLWLLHCRDKLSLLLRKLCEYTPFHSESEKKRDILREILTWIVEINKQAFSSVWKEETISIALTAASNVPPSLNMVQALARMLPEPSKLPSLLKDKANRLFDSWRNTHFENDSKSDAPSDFFSLFEKFCMEENKCLPEDGPSQSVSEGDMGNQNFVVLHKFQRTSRDMEREYLKLVSLFASMNFAKDAETFLQLPVHIPSLTEFSHEIRQLEFEGLRIRKQIFDSVIPVEERMASSSLPKLGNARSKKELVCKRIEKKGIFRNLTYSDIWQENTNAKLYINRRERLNTIFHKVSGNASRRTQSLSPLVRKSNRNASTQDKYNAKPLERMTKHRRSFGRSSLRSSSLKQKRSKSLQVAKEEREKKSKMLHLKNKLLPSSYVNLAFNLKQLLSYIRKSNFMRNHEFFQEDILFIYWMMSNERIFLSSPIRQESRRQKVAMKTNLQTDDIICALMWLHFPLIVSSEIYSETSYIHEENVTLRHDISVSEQSKKDGKPSRRAKIRKKHSRVKRREILVPPIVNENPPNEYKQVTQDKEDDNGKEEDHSNIHKSYECPNTLGDEECLHELKTDKTDGTVLPSTSVKDDGDRERSSEFNPDGSKKEKLSSNGEEEHCNDSEILGSERDPDLNGGSEKSLPIVDIPEKGPSFQATDSVRPLSLKSFQLAPDNYRDMKVQLAVPEELKNLVHAQQDGIQAMISAVDRLQKTFEKSQQPPQSYEVGNQAIDISKGAEVTKENFTDDEEQINSVKQEVNNENSCRKKSASKEEPAICSKHKNSWKPFKLKPDGQVKPPRLVIEVQDTIETKDRSKPETSHPVALKKKSLTPVETPSEMQDLHYFGITKLLHLSPENKSSEKLTLSDLDTDEGSACDFHKRVPVDDTLDDITLPDSLHASDLEVGMIDESLSQHAVYEKLIRKPDKNNGNESNIQKIVCKDASVKDPRAVNLIRTRSKHQWDEQLQLKPVPLKIKQSTDKNINKVTRLVPQNQVGVNSSSVKEGFQTPLKLLALPKQEEKYCLKSSPKAYKPLILRKIPFGIPLQSLENQSKDIHRIRNEVAVDNSTFNPTLKENVLNQRERKLQKLTLLSLPPSASNIQGEKKTGAVFKFLHPTEVFSFYKKHINKVGKSSFKTLKVTANAVVQSDTVEKEMVNNRIVLSRKMNDDLDCVTLKGQNGTKEPPVKDDEVAVPLSQEKPYPLEIPSRQQDLNDDNMHSPHRKASVTDMPSLQRRPKSAEVLSQRGASFVEMPSAERKPPFVEKSSLESSPHKNKIPSSRRGTSAGEIHSLLEAPSVTENQERPGYGVSSEHERSSVTEIPQSRINSFVKESESVDKRGGDHGFLSKIQDYGKTYRMGLYKDILEDSKFPLEEKNTISGFHYVAAKQTAELNKLQRQSLQDTKETQTVEGNRFDDRSKVIARPAGEAAFFEDNGQNSVLDTDFDSGTNVIKPVDYEKEMFPRKLGDTYGVANLVDSRIKHVKDSWTDMGLTAAPPTEKIEMQTQTQHKTVVDASVTAQLSPPATSSSSLPDVPLPFNPAGLIVNLSSEESYPKDASGNVAHIVDIPADIVQKQLKAIGDDLNQTIPSILPSEPLQHSSLAAHPGHVRGGEPILQSCKGDTSETMGSNMIQNLLTEDRNRTVHDEILISSPLEAEAGIKANLAVSNRSEHIPRNDDLKLYEEGFKESDEVCGKGDYTMESLMQAFMGGKITFERFCELSNNAVNTDVSSGPKIITKSSELHIEDIEELEKEAEEAFAGLKASKKLLSKLDNVMQESQRIENQRSLEKLGGAYSSRTTSYTKSKKNKASLKQEWEKVQLELCNTQNADSLHKFIDNVNPEDISDEMIDVIIKYAEAAERIREVESHPVLTDKISHSVYNKQTPSQRYDAIHDFQATNFGTRFGSPDLVSESNLEVHQVQGLCSPDLRIDLRGLRSESSSTFGNTPRLLSSMQSNLSPGLEKQRKREEIRKWMKEKRKQRIKKSSELPGKGSRLHLFSQKDSNPEAGPKQGFTGKEIRDSSLEREEKRRHLSKSLHQKLENDMNELLDDHNQQASSHRDLLHGSPSSLRMKPPQGTILKPVIYRSKTSRRQRQINSESHNSSPKKYFDATPTFAMPSHTSLNETFTIANNRPSFNETYTFAEKNQHNFNETFTVTKKKKSFGTDLAKETGNPVRSVISIHNELDLETVPRDNSLESVRSSKLSLHHKNKNAKNIEVELNKLTKCIQSVDNQTKPRRAPLQTGKAAAGFDETPKKEILTKILMHQRATSVSLPLDRISEVDSDTFSSYSVVGEAEEKSGNGSSSDISWNVPPDVKKVLYN